MKTMTAQWVTGDAGFARLATLPKWGDGNTSPTPHQQPRPMLLRISLMSGGNNLAAAFTVALKTWSLGDGTPQLSLTTDRAVVAGVEVYVESGATQWVLLARTTAPGDRVVAELISPTESGFLDPVANEPFTYTPTGHLIKPVQNTERRTPSTPSASQWIKLATIKGIANYTRYSAVLTVAEVESVTQNASIVVASLQINAQSTVSAAQVGLQELTNISRKTFELHYTSVNAGGVNTVEIWGKTDLTNSTLALSVLTESQFTGGGIAPSVQYHDTTTWTGTSPTSPTRMRSGLIESGLTFANSWAAASGYGSVRSTGVMVIGRMAYLNMTVAGGTTTANTAIATVAAAYAPSNTIDVPCLVTDGSNVHTLGRLSIFNTGVITIVGAALAANTKVTAQAAWPIPNFG